MDILDTLGCEKPVVQAGMADISRSQLAAAVSLAGGIGTVGLSPEPQFEADILDTKHQIGARSFAANLLMPFVTKTHVEICIRNAVPIVVLFFGCPKTVVADLKAAGALVLAQVGSLEEANDVLRRGVDGLIVQGREAGGHVRGNDALHDVLPLIRERHPSLPIIAAGGIYDRNSARAALASGADAVCSGTRFLMTPESFAHEEYKARLAQADTTVLTKLFGISWPDKHRVIPNEATRKWTREGEIPTWLNLVHRSSRMLARARTDRRKMVARQTLARPIYTPSPLKPGMDSESADVTALYAGECVAQISEQMDTAQVVLELAS